MEAAAIARGIAGLDADRRAQLLRRVHGAQPSEPSSGSAPRCVMLEPDGSCAVYDARPLVCRTQGMALRYPPRTFPEEAVMAQGSDGSDIVWCPLNFTQAPPQGSDVLEAGRLDEMLALVNLEHVGGDRDAALDRWALEQIVLDTLEPGSAAKP